MVDICGWTSIVMIAFVFAFAFGFAAFRAGPLITGSSAAGYSSPAIYSPPSIPARLEPPDPLAIAFNMRSCSAYSAYALASSAST